MKSGPKTNPTQNIVTGNIGENIVRTLLNEAAFVSKPDDRGEDLHGELIISRELQFRLQSKASGSPEIINEEFILAWPINCSLIEQWLRFPYPVYVFMTDARTRETFFIRVCKETYKPTQTNQKQYKFRIPLKNKLQTDNVGDFIKDVIEHQKSPFTLEERKQYLDEYYTKYPYLFQNLDEIDKLLEIMRGSDQSAQLEAKKRIQELYVKGKINPKKHNTLTKELIQIFRNCKDRITQYHVIDALVSIHSTDVIKEIPLQIDRNVLSFDRYQTAEQMRHVFSDFLFDALVKLNAKHCYPKIQYFLSYKDIWLLRGVIRTVGRLSIKEAIQDIIGYLDDPRFEVREEAVLALSRMQGNLKEPELKALLKTPRSDNFLASVIQLLGYLKCTDVKAEVCQHLTHKSRNVRKQVAFYLGEINATDKLRDILVLTNDDDNEVRDEALRTVVNKLTNSDREKAEQVLTPLEKLDHQKEYQKCNLLIGIVSRLRLQEPLPLLVEIYKKALNETITYRWVDEEKGHQLTQSINVKVHILEILQKYKIPEIEEDILENIQSADQDTQVKYIIAAGEMRIQKALPLLIRLLEEDKVFWRGFILQAAIQIDEAQTKQWIIDTLKQKPSLELSITCLEGVSMLGQMMGKDVQREGVKASPDLASRLFQYAPFLNIPSSTGMFRFSEDDELHNLAKSQIIELYKSKQNRREKRLFKFIQLYKVYEVEKLIVEDINGEEINMVSSYDMLQTLVALNPTGHRDLLIRLLPSADETMKRFIIEWLGNIKDEVSLSAICEYQNYPSIDIRDAANKALK